MISGAAYRHRKAIALNWGGYAYGQGVTLAMQFLLVPFFLISWGTTKYAAWLVLTGIPTLLSVLDFGISQASASRATMQMSSGDTQGARATLGTSLLFTLTISLAVLASAISVAPNVPWAELLNIDPIGASDAAIVVIAMSVYLCASFASNFIDAWFRTIGHAALGAFLLANRRVVEIALCIALLTLSRSPVEVAVAMAFAQWLVVCISSLVAHGLSPDRLIGIRNARLVALKEIWRPAAGHAGIPVAQVITLHGGLQVLSQIASPAVVVAYSMARTLVRTNIQLGLVTSNAIRPVLSKLVGGGDASEARDLSRTIGSTTLALALAGYAVIVALGPAFVDLWSQGVVSLAWWMLPLIGAHAVLNVAWLIPASLDLARNRSMRLGFVYSATAVASLLLWATFPSVLEPFAAASLVLAIPEVAVLLLVLRGRT